jgi:hypothetical protein
VPRAAGSIGGSEGGSRRLYRWSCAGGVGRYAPPVTDADASRIEPTQPPPVDVDRRPGKGFRLPGWRLWVTSVVVVVIGLSVLLVIMRGGDREVRYEVTSEKGTVRLITWEDGSELGVVLRPDPPDDPGNTIETPWSATVNFKDKADDYVAVAVGAGQGDMVTCRIIAGGKVVRESTTPAGALCDTTLAEIFGEEAKGA